MAHRTLLALAALALSGCVDTAGTSGPPSDARPARAADYNSVVVFGDSLVDAGNARILTNGQRAAPEQGYVAGRITNGYTYADRISMGVAGRVTAPSRSGGNNYAHAGARALTDSDPIPDAAAQIETYRATLRGRPRPRTLFILNFGANDLRRPPGAEDLPGGIGAHYQEVARSYAAAVRSLFGLGAQTILVAGIPIPSPAAAALQRQLDAELERIPLSDGQRLLRYDFFPFWREFLPNAASLGFRPWTAEQLAGAVMPGTAAPAGHNCVQDRAQATGCAGYILFDRTHPVASIHALVARDMAERLSIPVADPRPVRPPSD